MSSQSRSKNSEVIQHLLLSCWFNLQALSWDLSQDRFFCMQCFLSCSPHTTDTPANQNFPPNLLPSHIALLVILLQSAGPWSKSRHIAQLSASAINCRNWLATSQVVPGPNCPTPYQCQQLPTITEIGWPPLGSPLAQLSASAILNNFPNC